MHQQADVEVGDLEEIDAAVLDVCAEWDNRDGEQRAGQGDDGRQNVERADRPTSA